MTKKAERALSSYLVSEILEFRKLATIAASQPERLTTLGDTASLFHGRALGLHQALFHVDPEAASKL